MLLFFGLRIFGNRSKGLKIAKYSIIIFLILAVTAMSYVVTRNAIEYKHEAITTITYPIESTSDTLKVNLGKSYKLFSNISKSSYKNEGNVIINKKYTNYKIDDMNFYVNNDSIFVNDLRLIIRPSNDELTKISVLKRAKGKNIKQADKRSETISYNLKIEDDKLFLDDFYNFYIGNKYRDQTVKLYLDVPAGKIVSFENSFKNFNGIIRFEGDYSEQWAHKSNYYKIKHSWKIDGSEIICADCPEQKQDDFY